MKRNLAIFDLDNTILNGDSDYSWINFLIEQGVVDKEEYLRILDIQELKRLTYEVSLKTGKNREIRRIFDSNNIKIMTLKRVSIGDYKLGNLKIGELREINS